MKLTVFQSELTHRIIVLPETNDETLTDDDEVFDKLATVNAPFVIDDGYVYEIDNEK